MNQPDVWVHLCHMVISFRHSHSPSHTSAPPSQLILISRLRSGSEAVSQLGCWIHSAGGFGYTVVLQTLQFSAIGHPGICFQVQCASQVLCTSREEGTGGRSQKIGGEHAWDNSAFKHFSLLKKPTGIKRGHTGMCACDCVWVSVWVCLVHVG